MQIELLLHRFIDETLPGSNRNRLYKLTEVGDLSESKRLFSRQFLFIRINDHT